MDNKKGRIGLYADEKTLRQLDWLARELKLSRSDVVERALPLIMRRKPARRTKKRNQQ
jgi:hypothetical protein